MNDQPTPDALSRANAYLDGELDTAEIAAAEADSAVMAEVAHLRALQEAVRAVVAPTASVRDVAIATALAEFDRKRHPIPVARSRPRPAYTRWLAVAAAVTGLAALGAVIATNSRGTDHADTAGEASADLAAAGSDASLLSRAATEAGAPAAPQPDNAADSQSAPASEQTAASAAAAYSAESDAAAMEAPATTAASAGRAASSPPAFDPTTPIPNDVELGRIGRQLLAEWEVGSRDSKTGTPCDGSTPDVVLLSDAVLIVNAVARPVIIAGNPSSDETLALDPDTCVIVATGQ